MKKLSIEQELFLLLSKVTLSDKDRGEIHRLSKNPISWCEVFKYALYNKVLSLVGYNLKNLKVRNIPKYLKTIAQFTYEGHKQQNVLYLKELNLILSHINKGEQLVFPVKGALLLDNIYPDIGVRSLGDLDFLVGKSDVKAVEKKLVDLGYVKGTYDKENHLIKPVDRKEDIAWRLGATNVHPYLKLTDSKSTPFIKVDLRHSLDDSLDAVPIEMIVEEARSNNELLPEHVLTHLVSHLYIEGTNSFSVLYNKDINIIKFCDVREFIVQKMNTESLERTAEFCKAYNLEQALYYTMFYLQKVYNDGYEENVLKCLGIRDIDFIREYTNHYNNKTSVWKKTFFERMFSSDNFDELDEINYDNNKSF